MKSLVEAIEQIEKLTKQARLNSDYIQTLQRDIMHLQDRVKKLEGK